jgi:hypothetical protein
MVSFLLESSVADVKERTGTSNGITYAAAKTNPPWLIHSANQIQGVSFEEDSCIED